LLAASVEALAQEAPRRVVEGTVFDSLALRPLARAAVQLSRRDTLGGRISSAYTAITDARGRFRFDGVAPGRYVAGFFHESLDSLGLEAPLREVRVADRGPYRVALGIPSARTIITTLCGARAASDTTGIFIGFVRHAKTATVIEDASVLVRWTRLVIGKDRVSLEQPEATAQTRPNGWYALCNVPVGWPIFLTAASGGDSSGVVEALAVARRIMRSDLYVGESERMAPVGQGIAADSLPRDLVLRRGPARLTIAVRTAVGQPVANAQVRIAGTPNAGTTNDVGLVSLGDLPAGSRTLDVRAIGYVPVRQTVHLLVRDSVNHAEVMLTNVQAYLDTIRISAHRVFDRDATGFERRRRTGLGRYIDRVEIDRQRPFRTSDLFRMLPAVYVEPTTFSANVWMRGPFGDRCRPAVFLDGVRFSNEYGDVDVLTVPSQLEAIEVYARAAQAPGMYADMIGGCGSVVLWTRRRWPTPKPER
jgi:hypothetical protein